MIAMFMKYTVLWSVFSVNNCRGLSWSASSFQPVVDNKNVCLTSEKPHCPYCGGFVRQNVLMFNDWSYASQYQDFKKVRLESWLKEVQNLVVIELGAGKAIPTVRRFSERTAKAKKGGFIRINLQDAGVLFKSRNEGVRGSKSD